MSNATTVPAADQAKAEADRLAVAAEADRIGKLAYEAFLKCAKAGCASCRVKAEKLGILTWQPASLAERVAKLAEGPYDGC